MKSEALKRLVIESITNEIEKQRASFLLQEQEQEQQHEDLRAVSKGLNEGRELELTILTGGLCNYSFRLHFKDAADGEAKNNDVSLFVKVTFANARLFPDVDMSPERLDVEFQMLQLYQSISPNPEAAVTPYLCLESVADDDSDTNRFGTMKILVSQYKSRWNEQAAHFFIEGASSRVSRSSSSSLSSSLAISIASGLSALHNAPVTKPNINKQYKDNYATSLIDVSERVFESYLQRTSNSNHSIANANTRAKAKAEAIGRDGLDKIITACHDLIRRSDCYVHGDCHVFNILMKGRNNSDKNDNTTDDEETNQTNRNGDVAVIDWEFAHCGAMGKDIGWVCGFPIACLLAHSLQGNQTSVRTLYKFLDTLWETYSSSIRLVDDKTDLTIEDVYRQVLGSLGQILGAYSAVGLHMEYLPIEPKPRGGREKQAPARIRESLGVLSMEFYEIAFLLDRGVPIAELRERFHRALHTEVQRLSPRTTIKQQQRRSAMKKRKVSSLRSSGHRVSDAHVYYSIASSFKRMRPSSDEDDDDADLSGSSHGEPSTPKTTIVELYRKQHQHELKQAKSGKLIHPVATPSKQPILRGNRNSKPLDYKF